MTNTSDNFDFDVLIVGSGMSGGWVAKEMCERGYKTAVLDRGAPLEHGAGYENEGKAPWEMPNRGRVSKEEIERDYEKSSLCYAFNEYTKRHFIKDSDYPFKEKDGKRFDWIRSARVGGKSVLWHRHSYRFSEMDFQANKQDGHGCDWPIRYDDLKDWYDYVERFAGISGSKEGLPQLPDGVFQKPFDMNPVELDAKAKVEKAYPGRKIIIGRAAHLTEPTDEQLELGRGPCQARNECQAGCSWGGYFSSLSATLPAADRTGNMTLVPNAMVQEVVYDAKTKRASGVRMIDITTGERVFISARVVFVCASTLATTQILLNSKSAEFPRGIGNTGSALGHYLMDHIKGAGANAVVDGYEDVYYAGRRPTSLYVPRFRNVTEKTDAFLRGYGMQGEAQRLSWRAAIGAEGIGKDLKARVQKPGPWTFTLQGFGEMLPEHENSVSLSTTETDQWGMPILEISCEYGANELRMKEDMRNTATEMLRAAGYTKVQPYSEESFPGIVIHEMGTARMGHKADDSYLNRHNQCHNVSNLFVTDGASMTSSACQNPSLTFMALSARAAAFADEQMKAGAL
ncbi:GMC oxidoreductase [Kordiimonas lacus]|uniref:Choline dehydrogenase n=1 Tax=Kordiimonas lacus TaxID=637679 RepID=A0A1G6SWM7_9PROT|nr:GMC family oxidoreductase [Kordiimonas lacus]SDD21218.1 Choline dehydrogenase [Kordiimonas lacus]